MKKLLVITMLGLLLPLAAGCNGQRGARACSPLCDSLGRTLEQWDAVALGSTSDSAVAATLHRFVSRRQGYLELLIYRPTAWNPRMLETFSYMVPALKTERKQ